MISSLLAPARFPGKITKPVPLLHAAERTRIASKPLSNAARPIAWVMLLSLRLAPFANLRRTFSLEKLEDVGVLCHSSSPRHCLVLLGLPRTPGGGHSGLVFRSSVVGKCLVHRRIRHSARIDRFETLLGIPSAATLLAAGPRQKVCRFRILYRCRPVHDPGPTPC